MDHVQLVVALETKLALDGANMAQQVLIVLGPKSACKSAMHINVPHGPAGAITAAVHIRADLVRKCVFVSAIMALLGETV